MACPCLAGIRVRATLSLSLSLRVRREAKSIKRLGANGRECAWRSCSFDHDLTFGNYVKSQIAELLGIYLRTESRMEVKLEFDHIQATVIQTSGRAFIRTLATLSELHVLYVRPRCDVEDLVRTHVAIAYASAPSRRGNACTSRCARITTIDAAVVEFFFSFAFLFLFFFF